MKSMFKLAMASIVALAATVSYAGTNVSAMYTTNKSVGTEGLTLVGATDLNKRVMVEGDVFVSSKAVQSIGGSVGIPLHVYNTPLILTPQVGVEYRVKANQPVGVASLRADLPLYKDFSLTAKTKYSHAFDKNATLEDRSFSIGLTKRF